MALRTWHSDNPTGSSARSVDRKRNEPNADGPAVPCCGRRLIAADMLVRVPVAVLSRVQAAMPHLVGDGPHYLCDGCRALLAARGHASAEDFHEPA